ncbi:uncharacterized protein si:ch211-142k18.1 [Syngnathus typhle]|uniref:uncharacterized protein si:ch211-142k18.1 n=1 Tax=Syngnathus typhle TaxID=161592 RepID=UPI002A6B8BF6|nr:uncharacterized protein si:ch211-142k18.1 [Syngnathus typhle]
MLQSQRWLWFQPNRRKKLLVDLLRSRPPSPKRKNNKRDHNLVNMRRWWTGVLVALIAMATPSTCQSGDGDYGSGFDAYPAVTAADEPASEETCSVRFGTRGASARLLKARREEVAFLQAIQHANRAVIENLVQYVGAELGAESYEDVIRVNVAGAQEEHRSCREVLEKAEEDLEKQLQGELLDTLAGLQKIREESAAFEEMVRAATDIAGRLESSSQGLHASFAKQLRDTLQGHV